MTADSIPKYCLTLPEKPHRREAAQKHFDESGVGAVSFVSGINGEAFGVKTVHPYTVDDPRDRPKEKWGTFICGHHETGIFLSHYMIWTAALLLPYSHVMIMEDDAKFLPGWKDGLDAALRDVPPDFDWLFVGSCGTANTNNRRIKGNVWEVRYPSCFHCYIISRRGAEILTKTQRKIFGPVDITVYHSDPEHHLPKEQRKGSQTAFDKIKVFTVLPRLVDQFNTEIPV